MANSLYECGVNIACTTVDALKALFAFLRPKVHNSSVERISIPNEPLCGNDYKKIEKGHAKGVADIGTARASDPFQLRRCVFHKKSNREGFVKSSVAYPAAVTLYRQNIENIEQHKCLHALYTLTIFREVKLETYAFLSSITGASGVIVGATPAPRVPIAPAG